MKKVGIVAEYNPFHNGHLYQLEEIKRMLGKDTFIAAVISGNFVQRGEFSYLNKWEKTAISLKSGVNLIVELPLYYSIQNAEIFSRMSTGILESLKLDFQVFGAEEENMEIFKEIIRLQAEKDYREKLLGYIKEGNSYGTAQRKVLLEYGYRNIIKSNNILALEYMRAMERERMNIKPYIIRREVSEYNENEIDETREGIAGATFIRRQLEREAPDFSFIRRFIPPDTFETLVKKYKYNRENGISAEKIKNEIFKFIKYKLLMERKEEIIKIYDITSEIYARIYKEVKKSETYETFLKRIKSRNFSNKRIERITLNILLNIQKEILDCKQEYIRVLGFDERGREYLKYLKSSKKNENIFVNWKDIEKSINSKKIEAEKNGFLVNELFTGEKERLNPIIVK